MKNAVVDLYNMGRTHSLGNLTTYNISTYSVVSTAITRSLTLTSQGNYIIVFIAGEGSDGSAMTVSDITATNGTVTQLFKDTRYSGATWRYTHGIVLGVVEANSNCVVTVISKNNYTQSATGCAYFFGAIKLS